MKIAIIGGGWVGCHLAHKLQHEHEVTIFEKNNKLFTETSYNNQNRLHLGFHYARSFETRELCQNTFFRFIEDYKFATNKIDKNLYCVAKNNSLLDYKTYLKIFEEFEFEKTLYNSESFEGCIITKEQHIDFKKMFDFFNLNLNFEKKLITPNLLRRLQKKYDLVINATNNHLTNKSTENSFYETTLSLIYKKIKKTPFDSITVVDGKLFSIYPYMDDLYTVTDVEFTPLKKFKKIKKLKEYVKNNVDLNLIEKRKKLIEKKITSYYPTFLSEFMYTSYFISTKTKIEGKTDSRYPSITQSDNLVNCFTGKIQGIYLIEDYIKKIIYEKNRTN
jgi:hypothetical protein